MSLSVGAWNQQLSKVPFCFNGSVESTEKDHPYLNVIKGQFHGPFKSKFLISFLSSLLLK